LSKRVAITALYSAAYIVATVVLAPISFLLFNVRIANILRGLLPFFPVEVVLGNMVAVMISNVISPLGPLDLLSAAVVTCTLTIAYYVGRRSMTLGYTIHWLGLSTWLVFLLHATLGLDATIIATAIYPQIFVSDLILPLILYRALRRRGWREAWAKG